MGSEVAASAHHNTQPEHDPRQGETRHRADYILERGVWHVTCRVCGCHAEGTVRRQLSSLFRFHLRPSPAKPTTD
jgi:hypothetical protein